jgi:hypothetical protein
LLCSRQTLRKGCLVSGDEAEGWPHRIEDVGSRPHYGPRDPGHLLPPQLGTGVQGTPRCRREGSSLGAGAWAQWEDSQRAVQGDRCSPPSSPAAFLLLLCLAPGCRDRGAGGRVGGWVAARADFFPCLVRPAYLHLCPFAGCWRLPAPDPLLFGQVKVVAILALDGNNKPRHVTVCSSATLHSQLPAFRHPPPL